MAKQLSHAQVNHLRRLLGWVRCEIWQSPEEMVETLKRIAQHLPDPPPGAEQRLAVAYNKAAQVPKYIREAVKALEPVVREAEGTVVDAVMQKRLRRVKERRKLSENNT